MKSTVTGSAETIKNILTNKPQYKEWLFSRGYLITEDGPEPLNNLDTAMCFK